MDRSEGVNRPLRAVHRKHRDLLLELVYKRFYIAREPGTGNWVVTHHNICEKGLDLDVVGREALRKFASSRE